VRLARHLDADRLDAFRRSMLDAALSYPEVGASLGVLPTGYRHNDDSLVLGTGSEVFERAVLGLREWRAHRGAGVTVVPEDAPIEVGTTVALALPLAGISTLAACRIVGVVEDDSRFGFAYGTLTGHPERGEEAFSVERDGDAVRFHIRAFSREADPLARLGAPVTRLIQRRVTRAYLTALQGFVRQSA
jgi:uncharacterized protein (UPF0548 family)